MRGHSGVPRGHPVREGDAQGGPRHRPVWPRDEQAAAGPSIRDRGRRRRGVPCHGRAHGRGPPPSERHPSSLTEGLPICRAAASCAWPGAARTGGPSRRPVSRDPFGRPPALLPRAVWRGPAAPCVAHRRGRELPRRLALAALRIGRRCVGRASTGAEKVRRCHRSHTKRSTPGRSAPPRRRDGRPRSPSRRHARTGRPRTGRHGTASALMSWCRHGFLLLCGWYAKEGQPRRQVTDGRRMSPRPHPDYPTGRVFTFAGASIGISPHGAGHDRRPMATSREDGPHHAKLRLGHPAGGEVGTPPIQRPRPRGHRRWRWCGDAWEAPKATRARRGTLREAPSPPVARTERAQVIPHDVIARHPAARPSRAWR